MKHINKTRWASVKITSSGSAVLCLKSATVSSGFYFENIEQLAEAIRKKQIRAKNWIVSVPDNLCIIKTIALPASDISQAYKMLEFELSSYLPLPTEELVYGCLPINKKDNLLQVLVYILKIKTLEDILAKFKSVGIKPSRVMVDSVAVQNWFARDGKNDIDEINLILGNESFSISAIVDGNLSRYEKFSLLDSDLESRREQITDEINHLATEISADKEQAILRIAVQTDTGPEIKSWFKENFKTIEFMEPPQLNSFVKRVALENEFIFESIVTQALVKAVEDSNLKFLNLLPGKALKMAGQKQLITNSVVAFALGVFIVFCLWLNFAVMNLRTQRACKIIAEKIAPIKNIASDVESKRQKVKAIQAQLSNREQISHIFSQLYKYSPKHISISQMNYLSKANAASLDIKGQADTLSNAFEYSDSMQESEILNNIQIINAQQIPKPGGSIVEFKAKCTVGGS